jgi:hypothetical protein
MDVTFFLAEGELESLRALDPDRDWRELQRGERAWVLQTYLRLARAGYPVRLANQLPQRGLVVFHLKQRRALLNLGRPPARQRRQLGQGPLFVGIRGDLRASRAADFEVVQNRRSAEQGRSFFIPHWPQPGLRPRDPARGAAVARIAYKGFDRNLHPYFRTPDWSAFLAARGVEWVIDSVPFAEGGTDRTTLDWPDFRAVDAVLAVRPDGLRRRDGKPATKLYNAWLAGIPALLGPDEAFAEIRRSPLDYLDVARPEEAKRAIGRLLDDPELYRRMVAHGRRRADEYTTAAIVERWRELFDELLPRALAAGNGRAVPGVSLQLRRWVHRAASVFV